MAQQLELPQAISRALALMEHPLPALRIGEGYLDLLGVDAEPPARGVQALWASRLGSAGYDRAQTLLRKAMTVARVPLAGLALPIGGRALDIGSGPGNITAALGAEVGGAGLALGVDVSRPMLTRAVAEAAGANVGFVRADAQSLPFGDGCFDGISCLMLLQLLPDHRAALAEMVRVLLPGGRLVIVVPGFAEQVNAPLNALLGPLVRVRFLSAAEIGRRLSALGTQVLKTQQLPGFQLVTAQRIAALPDGLAADVAEAESAAPHQRDSAGA